MAAAVMVVASATVLALVWSPNDGRLSFAEEVPLFAETVVPSGLVSWLETGTTLSLVEFVEALEEDHQ